MTKKQWKIAAPITTEQRATFPELEPSVVQLLLNRGLTTQAQVDAFLQPDFSKDVHDPYLMRDMRKAIDRIVQAIQSNEKIKIFGDYDVDGVSSVSVLLWMFRDLKVDNVSVYLPDRYTEGYGLNIPAIEQFAKDGVQLLITCDCGTSNFNEVARANELGLQVIILDHHKQAEKVPEAFALLNPFFVDETYPEKKLCTTGIAYKVAAVLYQALEYGKGRLEKPLPQGWEKWLLDLVALATVADMMPLLGENRTFVKHGLTVLRKTRRVGIKALADVMGMDLTKASAGSIGFQFGPRLNAAGRITHANAAFELLTTDDPQEATRLARELHDTNTERQKLTEKLFAEALPQIPKETPVLVSAIGKDWPSGVVGLVAGRLKELYHRPALAIGLAGDRYVGSGRSVGGFDITAALVESKQYLAHFGGHPAACGFTVKSLEDLEPFLASMRAIAERKLSNEDLLPEQRIDAVISLADANWALADAVAQFEPYGMAAPEPVFASRGITLTGINRMGKDEAHVRLVLSDGTTSRKAVGFRFGKASADWKIGGAYDVAYTVSINEWNGNRELQLVLVDILPST